MCELTDLEIIKRVRAGNAVAYEDLVVKYEKKLYSAVMSMVHNEQDSMDILQNIFLKAYLHIGNFNGESEYYTYLFRIALNECRDYWKKQSRKNEISLENENGETLDISDSAQSPSDAAQAYELKSAVNDAISNLDEDMKQVLILRAFYGMSYDEIALITGAEPGTVKSRLFRGRQKVKDELISRNLL